MKWNIDASFYKTQDGRKVFSHRVSRKASKPENGFLESIYRKYLVQQANYLNARREHKVLEEIADAKYLEVKNYSDESNYLSNLLARFTGCYSHRVYKNELQLEFSFEEDIHVSSKG